MDVVVYRAKIQGKYVYDCSFNPKVDFEYLNNSKNIKELEVITPFIPLYMGKFILRIIKRSSEKKNFFIPMKDRAALKILKKLNIEKVKEKVVDGMPLPTKEEVKEVLDSIGNNVVNFEALKRKLKKGFTDKDLYNILQILHIERKIKINPLYGKRASGEYCDICDETCEDCFLGYSKDEVLIYKREALSIGGGSNIRYRKSRINEEVKRYVETIARFISSKGENLVVTCPPMLKKVGVLYGAIFETMKQSGRVLYVTNKENISSLKRDIENVVEGVKIHVFDEGTGFSDADILICAYTNIPAFRDDFNLSILDDRISFVEKPYKNIFYVCKRALKINGKFINISLIPLKYKNNIIKGSSNEITLPPIDIQNPIPEPKFIISRYIDERTVYLPDISLDMLKWSLREGSKIIIFTPNNKISIYMKNYLSKIEDIKASIGISSDKNRDDYYSFVNSDKNILISSNYIDSLEPIYNINVIVMYSDSEKYSEDILLYMCSMANNHTTNSFRESLFIANKEEENMLRAKSIIRSINKVAWENGYIK